MKARLPIREEVDADNKPVEQPVDPAHEYRIFAAVLARFRKKRMTQTKFAKRMGRTQVFAVKLEQGVRKVDVIELLAMLKILDVRLDTFMKAYHNELNAARPESRLRDITKTAKKARRKVRSTPRRPKR